jgi:Flp pilus assembly protein TadG
LGIRTRLPRQIAQRCARLADDDGSSAIELALLAPALIILTMLVIQWALWFQARQVALDAAQAGARVAREQEPGWPGQSVAEANKFYDEVGSKVVTGITASVNPDGGDPNQVYVTVVGSVPTLIPGIPTLKVHETAGGDVECFRPATTAGEQCANG